MRIDVNVTLSVQKCMQVACSRPLILFRRHITLIKYFLCNYIDVSRIYLILSRGTCIRYE